MESSSNSSAGAATEHESGEEESQTNSPSALTSQSSDANVAELASSSAEPGHPVRERRLRSSVWKHFLFPDRKKKGTLARCTLCPKEFKSTTSSGNLALHLAKHHNIGSLPDGPKRVRSGQKRTSTRPTREDRQRYVVAEESEMDPVDGYSGLPSSEEGERLPQQSGVSMITLPSASTAHSHSSKVQDAGSGEYRYPDYYVRKFEIEKLKLQLEEKRIEANQKIRLEELEVEKLKLLAAASKD